MNKAYIDKRLNQLPSWLWPNSTTLPPIYRTVWEAVKEDKIRSDRAQTEILVDTNKVFPLLLTSQLSTEILGHIWSLANQKYAGQLTEQELYIVLALVAAAQASYTFNSLDILHLLPFPPTPYLNVECILNAQPIQSNLVSKTQGILNEGTAVNFVGTDGKYISKTDMKNKVLSGLIIPETNAMSQTFGTGKAPWLDSRQQSASISWDLNNGFRDTKQLPRVEIDIKQTSSATDPSDDFTEFQSAPIPVIPNIPMWDTKQGSAIGSRLANHNLGVKKPVEKIKRSNTNSKPGHSNTQLRIPSIGSNHTTQSKEQLSSDCLSDLFPKCSVKNQSKTVILKDTAIRNDDLPKEPMPSSKDELCHTCENKSTLPKSDIQDKLQVVLNETEITQKDLMNLQVEDKYSALRMLIQEPQSLINDINTSQSSQPSDEFGEFVSAGEPAPDISTLDVTQSENFADIFTDFEFARPCNDIDSSGTTDLKLSNISKSLDNLRLEESEERLAIDDRLDLIIDNGKTIQKEDALSINSMEMVSALPGPLTRSGSVPSLDLKSFLPSNTDEDHTADTGNQVMYYEWKQYMESCILLLQVAANIFTNISSESVLNEVVNSAQGYTFLCNLAEVAAVCRRVNFSYKELDINIIGFDDLLMDIDRIWAEMEPFYANIPIVTELPAWPLHQGECIYCALCLTIITSGRVVCNESNYHATCANLWLNCVNNHLPTMKYPMLYSQQSICAGNSHI